MPPPLGETRPSPTTRLGAECSVGRTCPHRVRACHNVGALRTPPAAASPDRNLPRLRIEQEVFSDIGGGFEYLERGASSNGPESFSGLRLVRRTSPCLEDPPMKTVAALVAVILAFLTAVVYALVFSGQ